MVKVLIAMHLPKLDARSKRAILGWLNIAEFEIPGNQDAVLRLQHDHILQELYSRGLADNACPAITIKEPITQPDAICLEGPSPKISLYGNTHSLKLITTEAVQGFRVSIKFSYDPLIGTASRG
ncbi:Receptor-like protein kinase [Corchorus olitorius]|uniref:Receptor-like protein kinase n=1 Tax=Corchorus olitorius TaxID=93759 RepID=A0A1R3KJR2_9ROSI|nr:Receptor-like protein kinase [Corchorus olitorius]